MISIVITTHGEMLGLPAMLDCLATQREYVVGKNSVDGTPVMWVAGKSFYYPIEVIVSYDGSHYQLNNTRWHPYQQLWPETKWITNKEETVQEFLSNKGTQENHPAGHHTRAPGIQAATGDWIVLTNSDNYFVSGWLHAISPYLKDEQVGMIYWNCVSNLWRWNVPSSPTPWKKAREGVRLERGFIDLSCVAVRADIAREVGFPYRNYDGDFDYIHACYVKAKEKYPTTVKHEEVLCVHN